MIHSPPGTARPFLPGLLGLLGCLGLFACQATPEDDGDPPLEEGADISWLFVQTANSGSSDGRTLTLEQVPAALVFSDRPERLIEMAQHALVIAPGNGCPGQIVKLGNCRDAKTFQVGADLVGKA